jgi:subtilisin-like proprotein convertase family protein
MIDECRSGYTLLSAEKTTEATVSHINTVIPDDNTTKSFDINIADNMTIEWVEATVDNDSSYASDYEIALISPSNTKSILMTIDTKVDAKNNWLNGGFRLSSAGFAAESSIGTWKLEISDKLRPDTGTLKSIKLKIYGH